MRDFLCYSHLSRLQLTIHQKKSPFQGCVSCSPEPAGLNKLVIPNQTFTFKSTEEKGKGKRNKWLRKLVRESLFFLPGKHRYSVLKRLSREKKKIRGSKKAQCHIDSITWECQPSGRSGKPTLYTLGENSIISSFPEIRVLWGT